MSSESSLKPSYNEFYDHDSVSELKSVDSYVIRDIHEKRNKSRKKDKFKKEPKTFFSHFFSTFGTCCVPTQEEINSAALDQKRKSKSRSKKKAFFSTDSQKLNFPRFNNIVNVFDSNSSDTTEELAGSQKSSKRKGDGRKEEIVTNKNIKWKIELKKGKVPAMSPEQKCWVCLVWCLKVENSQKMTEKMIIELFKDGVLQKEDVNITHLLKNKEEFFVLETIRKIESRMLESIMSEMLNEFEKLTSNETVYLIIEKIRVIAIYARSQGEILDICIFDTSCPGNKNFPPCYYGFRSFEEMQSFVGELYNNALELRKSDRSPFIGWLMKSKLVYSEEQRKDYSVDPKKKTDFVNRREEKLKDPKFNAKNIYTSMYKATEKPLSNEMIFSMDPTTGIKVQRQESIDILKCSIEKQEHQGQDFAKTLLKKI